MRDKILNWTIARAVQARWTPNKKPKETSEPALAQQDPPPLQVDQSLSALVPQKRKGITTTDDWEDRSTASFMTMAVEKSYDKKKKIQTRTLGLTVQVKPVKSKRAKRRRTEESHAHNNGGSLKVKGGSGTTTKGSQDSERNESNGTSRPSHCHTFKQRS